jgi:hypothetical protein
VIEDPLIVLASNQTGSPSVDIGFIGERGDSDNIAFVWDESSSEFVTVFTSDTITNTTVTISSYANFHTNDANIGGNLAVGGNVSFTGNVTSLNVTGNITGGNLLTPGVVTATGNITGGNLSAGSGTIVTTGNINGANVNASSGVTAGTTVIATGNVSGGNLTTTGITSTGSLTASTTIDATGNISGGNLTTAGITSTGSLTASTTINATGNITGGNVSAGSGIISTTGNITGGNINTAGQLQGGNIVITGDDITDTNGRVNFNTAGADVDFAVNGDTVANVFYVDAGTGTASFGSATQTTNALVAFNATNSVLMPVGNVAQRPATGVTGMLRFNTTADALEVYDNAQWTTVGVPSFTVIADEQFNGDGITVAFTLGSSQTTASCIVSINGVVQIPTIAYSVSGTTLTFTEAPEPGDIIDVRQITTTTTVTTISNVSGNAAVGVSDTTNDVSITGDLIPTGNATQSLGSPTNYWSSLYVAGNTIHLGNLQLKAVDGTMAFYESDGTTPAPIAASSVDTSQIASGTSSVAVIAVGGNVRTNIAGATVQTISSTGVEIIGNLSVTGNATLSGNILGDRVQNGTTSIDIQTPSGNANITVGATSNVAVFTTAGANIAGTLGVTGNITGGNLSGTSIVGTLTTAAQTNITSVGTLGSLAVTGNISGANLTGAHFGSGAGLTGIPNGSLSNSSITVNGTAISLGSSGTVTANASTLTGTVLNATVVSSSLTSVGTLGSLTVTANVAGGNLTTAGQVVATGNITGGNLKTSGVTISSTGVSATTVTATANVAGGNLTTAGQVVATGNVSGGNLVATTAVSTASIIKTGSNAVGNIGSSSNYFNTVFAQATSALYADLAEKYIADAEYAPGTVVVFGGNKEVTVSSTDADRAVAGVISTNPSYIMNGGLEAEHVATVALTGRVPCRVTGTVRKGDLMVSAGYGLARADQDPRVGTVIGKALENYEGNEGVIEVVVGRF